MSYRAVRSKICCGLKSMTFLGSTTRGSLIVLGIAVVRLGFIPLFLFCNISPNNRNLTSVSCFLSLYFRLLLNLTFTMDASSIENIFTKIYGKKKCKDFAKLYKHVAQLYKTLPRLLHNCTKLNNILYII